MQAQPVSVAWNSILDEANDPIFILDLVHGRLLYFNHAALALLGYSPSDLAARSIFELFPKSLHRKSESIIAQVWEEGGLIFDTLPLCTLAGEEIAVECSGKVITFGKGPAILLQARDIRERKRLQGEILAKQALLEEKNQDITDSITHASRIQNALLPAATRLATAAPHVFLYFRPRDIVSGDFYFHFNHARGQVLAVVDCTGHGVPGAFMSVLGHTFLQQILYELTEPDPARILTELDMHVRAALASNVEVNKQQLADGMDMALVVLNRHAEGMQLQYAGANRPLLICNAAGFTEVPPTKAAIGGKEDKTFESHTLTLHHGDWIYLYSDGVPDQFGGLNQRKYTSPKLREFLKSLEGKTTQEKAAACAAEFDGWKKDHSQTDDMLLMGIGL